MPSSLDAGSLVEFLSPIGRLSPFRPPVFTVKMPRKTSRYECVGGPRDGDMVLIQRSKQNVTLDGALYEVRLWAKMDEHGQRLLWKREALVWEGLLIMDTR